MSRGRKMTKRTAAKKGARKTAAKTAKRRRVTVPKKARKAVAKDSAPKGSLLTTMASPRAFDLLRAWSSSRYSTR
jgi:hypothetical protein